MAGERNAPGARKRTARRTTGDCDLLLRLVELPRAVVQEGRRWQPVLAAHIAEHVQKDIRGYVGGPDDRRRRVVLEVVDAAISDFFTLASGSARTHQDVDRRFREVGAGMATEGRDFGPMLAALQVASADIWKVVRTAARTLSLPGEAVALLGELISDYLRHLTVELERGYAAAHVARRHPRTALFYALIGGASDFQQVLTLAGEAGWSVPDETVVLVLDGAGTDAMTISDAMDGALSGRHRGLQVVVLPRSVFDARSTELLTGGRRAALVAVSWPVAVRSTPHAYRWARRLLELRRAGRISDGSVVACADHLESLWDAADPQLGQVLAHKVLEPLEQVPERDRQALQDTLLRWLITRETAEKIAVHLGVHAQTVRNRMRRLRTLFGDDLTDPHRARMLVIALGAVVDANPSSSG